MSPAFPQPLVLDRLLAAPGTPAEGEASLARRGLAWFVLFHLCMRGWQLAWSFRESDPIFWTGLAIGQTVLLIAGLRERWVRPALLTALLVMLVQARTSFPDLPNHMLLELACAGLLAAVSEPRLAMAGVRWLAITVLFWSGLQKLLAGTWMHGEFLSVAVVQDPRFASALGWLLPDLELARLTAMGPEPGTGSGPWRVEGLLAWFGRAVWFLELTLPLLMLHPRTRKVATVAAIVLLAGMGLVTRELFLVGLMAALLVGMLGDRVAQRGLPWIAGLEVLGLLTLLVRPEWRIT